MENKNNFLKLSKITIILAVLIIAVTLLLALNNPTIVNLRTMFLGNNNLKYEGTGSLELEKLRS